MFINVSWINKWNVNQGSYIAKPPVSLCSPHPVAPTFFTLATWALQWELFHCWCYWHFHVFIDTFDHSLMLQVLSTLLLLPMYLLQWLCPVCPPAMTPHQDRVPHSCIESLHVVYIIDRRAKLLREISFSVLISATPSQWDLDINLNKLESGKISSDTHGTIIRIHIFLQHGFILFGPRSHT